MRGIGLHLRLNESIVDIAHEARDLQLPFFQCFFVRQSTNKLIKPTDEEIKRFVALRQQFDAVYVHGSYWINLAGLKNNGYYAFKRELALAKKLDCTHMILHSGSAKGAKDKVEGIDALAGMLNKILKKEKDIKLVLENTAHGRMSIGSDITDFGVLLEKLDQPDRIAFSIDTSHAFAYGYNIADTDEQDAFINLIDTAVGAERVVLIHLNDSYEKVGTQIDRHALLGQGLIGQEALKRFVLHDKMCTIPLLMEPPVVTDEEKKTLVQQVREWHKESI